MLLDHLRHDLRHALRQLRRSPGFAAVVVLTLGLGIGANAAVFGVVDRLMFRPYPYLRDPSTVHRVYNRWMQRGTLRTESRAQYASYLDLARWTSSFSEHAAFANRTMAVGTGDASRERMVSVVSATFFDFFDARPALGRFFAPDEDVIPRGADVAVLGYGYWRAELGGRDVRGEVIQVGQIRATIVGVAPEGFSGTSDDDPPAVYIPITTFAGSQPGRDGSMYFSAYYWSWMEIMVRRKPGVTVAQATADATEAAIRSWEKRREIETSLTPSAIAKPNAVVSAMRVGGGPDPSLEARTSLWVAGVAAIVLLIACANVANLFVSRALERHREFAVRLALGVRRRRLAMQSLSESMVLAIIGGVVGLLIAQWGGAALGRLLFPSGMGRLDAITDARTLIVASGVTLIAGVLTGLVPALLQGATDLAASLRAGGRGVVHQRTRIRGALLVTQAALSVALLVAAGLFVKSLGNVEAMPMGYDGDRVLIAAQNLRGLSLDSAGRLRLGNTLLATAQEIPGVEYASWVMTVPLTRTNSTGLFVPGIDSVERLGRFTYQAATADYFRVMGTRILRGRGFTAEDRAGAPRVAVVSESMARTLWPGKDAIGQCIRVFVETNPCSTVVGIAEDIVQGELTATQRLHYYLQIEQSFPSSGYGLLLRMRDDVSRQRESVRKALQRAMPGQSYITVRPLAEIVDGARRSWRLGATTFAGFGLLALVVAGVGLYGVISHDVAQRMREIGIRVALGAQSTDIVRLVVGHGLRFALAGIAVGGFLALAASRWLEPLLFRQSPTDPWVYGSVSAVLLIIAIVASASPALRGAKADPNAALRAE